MTGFYAGNVLLAKVAVVPNGAHFSCFDEVCCRCETIDLEPDCDTSVLLVAEPATPVSELPAGIDSGRTKVEQGDTVEAPAEGVAIAITENCDLAVPKYSPKAVRAGSVPQASVECLPKRLGQSWIVHWYRFLARIDPHRQGEKRLTSVSAIGAPTVRMPRACSSRGQVNPVLPRCDSPPRYEGNLSGSYESGNLCSGIHGSGRMRPGGAEAVWKRARYWTSIAIEMLT